MSVQIRRSLVMLSTLTLAACANAPPPPRTQATANLPGKPGCFWLRNFTGSWTVLNQSQLLVYAPLTSPPYLLQLFQPVPTLKLAERLGFANSERSGMVCDYSQDDLVVPNWQPHRIPIIAVRQLTRDEARALMLANGLKVPAQKAGR